MAYIESNNKYTNILLDSYVFIFIFSMMNREFLPFGIDLRIPLVIMSLLLSGLYFFDVIKGKKRFKLGSLTWIIVAFYVFCVISNINWINSSLVMKPNIFFNIIVLYGINFLSIMIFSIYKEDISIKSIYVSIFVSAIVLFVSMMLVLCGLSLKDIMGGPYPGKVSGVNHTNFLGNHFRLAGYAEDANYTSMFMIILTATSIRFCDKRILKWVLTAIGILGFMLSASKTVLLGVISGLIGVLIILKVPEKICNVFIKVGVLAMCVAPYFAIKLFNIIGYTSSMNTMSTRYEMWNNAIKLFGSNPLFGNGLTSARSAFWMYEKGWYVQTHSTIIQIMSENGIIALLLFGLIIYMILQKKELYTAYITVVFSVFCLTSELAYLTLFAFIIGLLPIVADKLKNNDEIKVNDKKVLFVINSLGKGGAERVVVNIANKMAELSYDVTIITIYDKTFYPVDERINIIKLTDVENENSIRKLLGIISKVIKLNRAIEELEKEEKFQLITSHLPLPNLICKLSRYNNRTEHVIHNVFSAIEGNHKNLLKFILKVIYNNCNIITVSSGVEKELIERYEVKPNNIRTIYNPIDINMIRKLSNESFEEENEEYILFCGRLTQIKRPDILINAYKKGEFYKEYKLILLGDGELREKLQELCDELNISDKVIFKGWESNVYRYMKRSKILVSCSKFEALPMNILEAFCVGANVVSTDCDFGPREIMVGEYKKFLAEMNDIDDLINKMKSALKQYPYNDGSVVEKFDTVNIINDYMVVGKEWNISN